jgi:hypothetical protein
MIGSSTTLKPQFGQVGSDLRKSLLAPTGKQPPRYTGQSTIQKPQSISTDTTEDAVNNVMAQGYQQGDTRYQMKQADRAGVSRGKGQQYMAQQEGVQAITKAATDAAGVRTADEKMNAQMRADYEKARELEAQNYGMASHNMAQSDWSKRFAQQQNALNLLQSLMNQPRTPITWTKIR